MPSLHKLRGINILGYFIQNNAIRGPKFRLNSIFKTLYYCNESRIKDDDVVYACSTHRRGKSKSSYKMLAGKPEYETT
jgi:hypothetical protein